MRDGRTLIGFGMATATYPANRSEAAAIARILPDGTAMVASGTQDLGTGTYTVMTQVAADALGFPPENVPLRARRFDAAEGAGVGRLAVGGERVAGRARSGQPGARQADRAGDRRPGFAACTASRSSDVTVDNGWVIEPLATVDRRDPAAAMIARNGGQPIEATATVKPGDEKQQVLVSLVRRGVRRGARRRRPGHDPRAARGRRVRRGAACSTRRPRTAS